ncbi:MAG: ester cyclase [Rhodospirillaceae bacterium]|nr:ester cyclase [Rhodospirillaceae bacterium]
MRNAFVVFALAALVSSAALADSLDNPAGMDPSCKGHEQNRETYLKELEWVVNGGRMELIDELIAPEYRNNSAPPGAAQGPDAIRQYLTILKAAFPDRKVKNEMLLCAGDYVIVRSTVTGTSKGPYFGQPPTGKSYSVMGTDIYLIKDGKFRARWGNEDAMGMMQQLGYLALERPAFAPAGKPPDKNP